MNTVTTAEKIGKDLKVFLAANLEDMAISHLEAWKERYAKYGGNKRRVEEDICINHDPSLEIDYVEIDIGRKLNGKEYDYVTEKFNREVIKQWKQGIN